MIGDPGHFQLNCSIISILVRKCNYKPKTGKRRSR